MTEIQFVEIKPFISCCKDLEVIYHIPSSIKGSSKHYIALCELDDSNNIFTWVWAGKIEPLEQEGITVKWGKGKVVFQSQVLPKLSDGREYFLMYCNEVGTILGESRTFQFCTDSDEFSSIDLQSAPSDDVVMISMHHKKAPLTTSSLHSNNDSFEVLSEQRYSDTAENKRSEYFSQSVSSTVIPKGVNSAESKLPSIENSIKGDDALFTPNCKETNRYQNMVKECDTDQEVIQYLKNKVIEMEDTIILKENTIDELEAKIATLNEQVALNTLSTSTVLVNSPKEDKEKRILKKRIQDETKKSSRLEELLDHKETKILQLENDKVEGTTQIKELQQKLYTLQLENKKLLDEMQAEKIISLDDATKMENIRLINQVEKLQTELLLAKKQNGRPEIELPRNKTTKEEIADLSLPVGGDYKTKLYLKLFKQDPFICHVCDEVLPAHTQEFTRLNHVQQCKGSL